MAGRKRLLAGNWKMFNTRKEIPGFVEEFVKEAGGLAGLLEKADLMFAVPYTLLETMHRFGQLHGFLVAAQNVHFEAQGAYTGEISVAQLRDVGVMYALVGHSERRQYFNETDVSVGRKVKACLAGGVMPIVCVGETREERESGRTEPVVSKQLQAIVESVPGGTGIVIAYEPVWAIGTGLSATADQAEEVHVTIRNFGKERFGAAAADGITILYGGSANAQNAASLFAKSNIDGALVGGASLKPKDFATMLKALV